MPQSLAQIYTHIVFSTKKRQPLLTNEDIRNAMHAYLTGTCKNQGSPPLAVGGAGDHVHILCRLSKNLAIAPLIKELKVDSSKWVKTKQADLATFQWQQGYGAFSVSPSHVDELRQYILVQMEHHRHVTFEDEFRRLCQKYGLPIDERYVWD